MRGLSAGESAVQERGAVVPVGVAGRSSSHCAMPRVVPVGVAGRSSSHCAMPRVDERAALAWTAGDGGDVETGLRLAASLVPFWVDDGLTGEDTRFLAAVLARPREPSLGRTRALSVAAFLWALEGDLDET